ncbi:MAG TPA: glycosyltransferase family 4 protein [Thermoanaerobaculia bacterium]|nr:glycosyltransferase family 4 protein [Thermoanaerobaculia bacterium]
MRVVYSIGRYQKQARRICDAVIAELRHRGWLAHLRNWQDAADAIPDCDLFHCHSVLSLPALRFLRAHRPEVAIVLQRDSAHVACGAYRNEIHKRRGGPYDALCVASPNVWPDKIPVQSEEYALADRVLVPSAYVARTFTAHDYPGRRLEVIPLPAGEEFAPPAEPPAFRVVLGGGATLTKGYPYAVEACALIGEPLDVLAGVPYREMARELGKRSVCLAPSITDGMPHQVLAAMACGLVPIVSTTNGCGDLLVHGVNGFIVELRDRDVVARIAGLLRWLREHPGEMRQIGRRAREAVAGRGWRDYGREVCDWYPSVLARRRRAARPPRRPPRVRAAQVLA